MINTDINQKKTKALSAFSAAILVIILSNPTVRLVDILPDFIACIIIIGRLTFYADRAPYFAECRDGFVKLAFVSMLRGPAFLIAAAVKSGNVADNDITVLLTFVFGVMECAILLSTVRDFFSAVFHVGMRGADGAINPFTVSKKGRLMCPESLRALIYIFIIFRTAGSILPEMLLLSRSELIGSNTKLFNFRALYPYFIVVLVPAILIFSIFLARRFYRYVYALSKDGNFEKTTLSLITAERSIEIENKIAARDKKTILSLFIIAVALSLDFRLADFSMIDLIPNFISGMMMFFALFKISIETKKELIALLFVSINTIISTISYITEFNFLDSYGYGALLKDPIAKAEYLKVMNLSFAEFLSYAISFIFISYTLILFLKRHTRIESTTVANSRSSLKHQKEMKIKVCIFSSLAVINGSFKLLNTIFNYDIDSTLVATDTGTAAVVSGAVPWFGSVVFISWLIYFSYSVYLFNSFKEEIDIKYS